MGLAEYEAKRRFNNTPEPPPRLETDGQQRFCVQRHHATRLHYDFRLEAEGVLKSWAVPRGPSLDPVDKRSAVHVEDHPVDYLTFEGVIPKGNYGAGSVMLWDLGTYELQGDGDFATQYERGDIKFALFGHKLRGRYALVRTKMGNSHGSPPSPQGGRGSEQGKQWLLIKKRDDAAEPGWDIEDHARSVESGLSQAEIARGATGATWSAAGRGPAEPPVQPPAADVPSTTSRLPPQAQPRDMPRFIEPMLPTAGRAFSHRDWMYELKWDGVRAMCHGTRTGVQLYSRRGNPIARQYPELEALHLNVAADSFILDGEIVALTADGTPDLERLQPRMHASAAQALTLSRRTPVTYYVFDLLYLNGYDLRAVPLYQRRQLLQAVVRFDPTVRLSDAVDEQGIMLFELTQQRGLEGVVAKQRMSLYEDGRRSLSWIKVKTTATVEAVIAGFTQPVDGRKELGALYLGLYEKGHLLAVGKAGTGFSGQKLMRIRQRLDPLKVSDCPLQTCPKDEDPVQWVQPRLVCEVKFNSWTHDRKMRGAVYVRLRDDKEPLECTFAEQVPSGAGGVPSLEEVDVPTATVPLLSSEAIKQVLTVDGHSLTFTNLNKVMYPQDGVTKRDILNFYDRIAPYLVPHLRDRPLTLKRYPNGIEGKFFFQRHVNDKQPAWLPTARIVNSEGEAVETFLIQDSASLLYLVNLGCLDQNMWLSRIDSLDHPDSLLLDLDPVECSYDVMVEAALALREILDLAHLRGYPKTSGGRGMHIFVPVAPHYSFDQTRMLANVIGLLAMQRHPNLFTLPRTVEKRDKGRVYLDIPQNRRGSSIAAPYVLRAFPGVAVATPLAWSELRPGLDPKAFNLYSIFDRLEHTGDLFRPVLDQPQPLEDAIERLSRLS